jgi:hypothetical protein
MWYVRLCPHYTYGISKGTRQKSFMHGQWKIFIFFKQKEGKRYININGAPTKYFRLFGKIVYKKNSRALRMGATKVNGYTFPY